MPRTTLTRLTKQRERLALAERRVRLAELKLQTEQDKYENGITTLTEDVRRTVADLRHEPVQSLIEQANRLVAEAAVHLAVFTVGQYEDDVDGNSGWAGGDWDGNADFNSSDFVVAFTDGGYELGPRPAAVPEPSSLLLSLFGVVSLLILRRAR